SQCESIAIADTEPERNHARRDPGYCGLHVPRTDERAGTRPADRHLRIRRRALRNADGKGSLRGRRCPGYSRRGIEDRARLGATPSECTETNPATVASFPPEGRKEAASDRYGCTDRH